MNLKTKLRSQWDRTAAAGAAGLGAVFLIGGWIGTSGTPHIAAQIPYMISGGIGGIFLLALAATLWLSADLRDQWRELRRLRVAQEEMLTLQQEQRTAEALPVELYPAAEVSSNGSRPRRRSAVATS